MRRYTRGMRLGVPGKLLLALLCAASLGASCGETNISAIRRLQPRGSEVRRELAELAALLPAPGQVAKRRAPRRPLSPPLEMDFGKQRFNAEVLMESQLTDPDRAVSFDVLLSADLLLCLQWTGPKNPLSESVWGERGDLGPECQSAFKRRYLGVVRTLEYALPRRVRLEVFLIDRQRRELLGAVPLTLVSSYSSDTLIGLNPDTVRSDAFVVARCEVVKQLAALGGGRIDLRESWPDGVSDPCGKRDTVLAFRVQREPLPRASAPAIAQAPPPATAKPSLTLPDPCGGATKPLPGAAPGTLRALDWCTRSYLPGIIELKNGRGELHEYEELGSPHDTDLFRLTQLAFGDLDGDDAEEAVIAIRHESSPARGPARSETRLFVYRLENARAIQAASAELGDPISLRIEAGVLAVEESGPERCSLRYRLVKGELVKDEAASRCTKK